MLEDGAPTNIVPVWKKKDDPKNYKLVNFISLLGKMLELWDYQVDCEHLENHGAISSRDLSRTISARLTLPSFFTEWQVQ